MLETDPVEAGLLDEITRPMVAKHEGARHLWLGDSRMGKTVANAQLIRWIERKGLVNVILTVDDKSSWEIQYPGGLLRVNPQHLRQVPPRAGENSRHVVFRGIAATKSPGPDTDGIIDDTARMSWDLVRKHPCTVCLNIDELADATNQYQGWKGETVAAVYRKGGAVGISIVTTTQLPQLLPREAFALSETIGIFRMTTRETSYLVKYKVITEADLEAIAALEVGQFRLYRKNGGLDPRVFKFQLGGSSNGSKQSRESSLGQGSQGKENSGGQTGESDPSQFGEQDAQGSEE